MYIQTNTLYHKEHQIQVTSIENERTTLAIQGPRHHKIHLIVYNLVGQKVKTYQSLALSSIELLKTDLPAGIYIYQLLGDAQLLSTGKILVSM
ncbi:MAG: T9SS type A sorting domain-containing protein [Aureispira sp.]